MFDAHSHFVTADSHFCTSEFLPQNYVAATLEQFKTSRSEIGLDKRYENRIPKVQQEELLERLLSISIQNNKTITLHCVQRTDSLIKILQKHSFKPGTVLWHGFNGSKETAKMLFRQNIIISIGPRFNKDLKEITKANPLFVLESDYEGNNLEEYNELIKNHYENCASKLGISIKMLEGTCSETGRAFKN